MMMTNDIKKEYFDWMYRLVCGSRYSKKISYRKLLKRLNDEPFTYIIAMDGNREIDGIELRYRFGSYNNYPDYVIASNLDDMPCSVLEMMIALSIRCEEHIMEDSDIGNRTGQWFWNMIVSLGLGPMTDAKYSENYVSEHLTRFLNREYSKNGEGGLFTVENSKKDMRITEIWYQMCLYLEECNDA